MFYVLVHRKVNKIPTDSATLIEEGLIQYFMKKNLTGDYYT